ncbi:MAG: RICIN domain-containing protein [Bryobacteraceae bacterium]|nr:RICIN domain-containing protein [Bryobacteraceae bacterium]
MPRTLFAAIFLALPLLAQRNVTGEWGAIIPWPHIPVTVAHLADGRIVTWASTRPTTFPAGETFTYSTIFDPRTNTFTDLPNLKHDMFCAGVASLADGRFLASGGGASVRTTSIMSRTAANPTWIQSGNMNQGRWYNSSVSLPDGRILTWWGRDANGVAEIFDPFTGLWTPATGINAASTADANDGVDDDNQWFPHLHVAPDGRVFQAGPLKTLRWLDWRPTNGSIALAGTRTPDGDRQRKLGFSIQYRPGLILFTGGRDDRYNPSVTNTTVRIDLRTGTPVVTAAAPMNYARAFHYNVMLPNGEVFTVGGNTSGKKFSDNGGVLIPEVWNPDTDQWRTLPAMAEPRGYHLTSLLLNDGRIMMGGSGLCGCAADHQNAQIYSPWYLFDANGNPAQRPTINAAATDVRPGLSLALTGSNDITAFNMIRLQATTHGLNSDSRFVPVPFTKNGTGQYSLALDSNANVLLPGLYWIFALNANGTPSLGYLVRVYTPETFPNPNPTVTITSPAAGATFASGATVNVAATVVDPSNNVARVEFFNGATKLGEDTTAPYTFSWANPPAGDQTITVRATNAAGLTGSANVTVRITAASAPLVSIASPANNSAFVAPATITIQANASDPDNNLARVEFFNGATKLGERTAAPYTFTWANVLPGVYTITARATDTGGLTANAGISISVNGVSASPARVLQSLKGAPVPEPSTLASFVTNRNAAIALGKALFWDTQVSSDGRTACASCHFQAGADVRFRNQMSPGLRRVGATSFAFDPSRSGPALGPNYQLKTADLPLHVLANAADPNSALVYLTKDVAGSQGVRAASFTSAAPGTPADACAAIADPIFGTARQVTSRHASTVVNAAFNLRNFVDGSANHIFNGVDQFGERNNAAVIYRGTPAVATRIRLENASLASQATQPPIAANEMSCAGRTWPDIARRLLAATALSRQNVAANDSVLAPYARAGARGLTVTYRQLIEAAFAADLWNAPTSIPVGGRAFTQPEANFSLFFGLAIQLYESTLISDDAPLDRYFNAYPATSVANSAALTPNQIAGLNVFRGKGRCVSCHSGPQLTNAGTPAHQALSAGVIVDRMVHADGAKGAYDFGFYNIGATPTANDIGLGANDPFGNPLSFTRQSLGGAKPDTFSLTPCSFSEDACTPLAPGSRAVVDGAFKTPTLRNISLTGPYFHNGSRRTLAEVVEFYDRGGDARGTPTVDNSGLNGNASNLSFDIAGLALADFEKSALVDFLENALTDDRVRFERAPFDHPELPLADTDTDFVLVPAVGASGRATPLQPFAELLAAGNLGYPVIPGNSAPTVSLSAPANAAAGATVTLTANAADVDENLVRVEFFQGSTKLGEATAAPYAFTWTNVPAGTYSLTARATDAAGLSATSSTVSLTVTASGTGPTPVNLAGLYNVTAIASDNAAVPNGGFDNNGYAYSGALLAGGVTGFNLGASGTPNAVSNTTLTLPAGNFASLRFLAAGANGNQVGQTFTVNYTDGTSTAFTQSVSDWFTPQNYAGETVASTMAYRLDPTGTADKRTFSLFSYALPLNSAKTVRSLTLPASRNVVLLAITLNPATAPVPDFSLSLNPASLSIAAGNSANAQITLTPAGGFTGTPAYAVSGLPTGVTSSVNGNTLTLTAAAGAPSSTATVTLSGTSGALIRTATLSLTVAAAVNPNGPQPVNLSGAYNVTAVSSDGLAVPNGGFDGNGYSFSGSLLGRTLTVAGVPFNLATPDAPNAVANAVVNLPAGTFSSLSFLASGANGNQAGQTFTVTYTDGTSTAFTQSVSDWFTPQGFPGETTAVTTAYRLDPTGTPDNRAFAVFVYRLTLNAAKSVRSLTLPANRDVVVLAVTLTPGTAPAPNFTLAVSPTAVTVAAGRTGTAQITLTPQNGFTGTPTYTATGLPTGVTAAFSGNTLTFTAAATAPVSTATVTITGTAGALVRTTTLNLTITRVAATVTLTAPATATAGASVALSASLANFAVNPLRVEFYNGTTKLGEDTTTPYAFTWTNVPAGTHSLTARAIDAAGAATNSPAVTLTVSAAAPTVFTSTVVNVNSTRCLTIEGASQADAANAIQTTCGTATNQQFRFNLVAGTTDVYTLTAVHSGKLLDVFGAATTAGARLIQWPSNGGDNQRFRLTQESAGVFLLTPMHSNLRVGILGNATTNNATVEQQAIAATTAQRWRIPGRP